jgi:two-component system chemotaxis response regulator CheY
MNFDILVVDDDDDDLMLLASHIKQCDERVMLTHVRDGIEATQKLTGGFQPNLIMVDANMPLMNGYDLLLWIMHSETCCHIPVVVWTGAISESEVVRYYRAGANSLMLKQDALRDIESFCHHWFKLVQLPKLVSAASS